MVGFQEFLKDTFKCKNILKLIHVFSHAFFVDCSEISRRPPNSLLLLYIWSWLRLSNWDLFFIFKDFLRFMYFRGRFTERDFPSTGSLPHMATIAGTGLVQSQELGVSSGSPAWVQGPKAESLRYCLPRKAIGRDSSQEPKAHSILQAEG